jgi:hypothetical protein
MFAQQGAVDLDVGTENNDAVTGVGVHPKPPLEGADDSYEGFGPRGGDLLSPSSPSATEYPRKRNLT